ncbi:MAG TPA: TIGR00266 family protein [Polyangiaceae bacterium]|nr:TIGR00266 family protein [Polyangiaceae bacterium]
MNHYVEHGPSFAWLKIQLEAGETLQAEAGAMVAREPHVEMETRLNAGSSPGVFRLIWAVIVAFVRKFLGGETMFVNRFSAPARGEVILAPALSGHVIAQRMRPGERLFVQRGSYLASSGSVDTRVRFTGLRSLLGGEGLVLLECSGEGDLWLNSYGGVLPLPVNGTFTVDTGHIVAFDGTLDFRVKSVGGMKSLLLSGEGLVCEFSGRGTVYIQSRNLQALVGWLSPLLPS